MKMEVPVLGVLESFSALWVRAGGNLGASRFCEVLLLDMRLPRGLFEEPLHPHGRSKVFVAETPEAETRRSESVGVDEGVTLIG